MSFCLDMRRWIGRDVVKTLMTGFEAGLGSPNDSLVGVSWFLMLGPLTSSHFLVDVPPLLLFVH